MGEEWEKNLEKLHIYVKNIDKGFILYTVNNHSVLQEVIRNMRIDKRVHVNSIRSVEEVDRVFQILRGKEGEWKGSIIVFDMFLCVEEVMYQCCDKINLLRDVLAAYPYISVFFVPPFMLTYIQNELPNLYSYFVLKLNWSIAYPCILDTILPDTVFLYTKKEYISKKEYLINRRIEKEDKKQSIRNRIEYLSVIKDSAYNVKQFLNKEIPVYLRLLQYQMLQTKNDELADTNVNYYISSVIQIVKMLQYQEMYGEAEKYLKLGMEMADAAGCLEEYKIEFYECMGANKFYLLKNDEALRYFSMELNEVLAGDHEFDYQKAGKIYNCISNCFFRENKLKNAKECIEKAIAYEEMTEHKNSRRRFENSYNQWVIRAFIDDEFKNYDKDMEFSTDGDIQYAMMLNVLGWYVGVLGGAVQEALDYIQTALAIEREVFIENSIHIAQSHYINAVLYNMAGEFSRSLRCCGKCLNILKNFEKEQEKKSVVISLKEKMEGAQGRTCDSV